MWLGSCGFVRSGVMGATCCLSCALRESLSPTRRNRESSSAGTSIGRLRRASPSLPVPAASTFSTMSALLFDYTNDLIATLLGRHVDEHVGIDRKSTRLNSSH